VALRHRQSVAGVNPSFFLAGESGAVLFADDQGHCSQVLNVKMAIKVRRAAAPHGCSYALARLFPPSGCATRRSATIWSF
jgi:hypothetical protein